jgi:hypothetical protein
VNATRPDGTISNSGHHGDVDIVLIPTLGMRDKTIRSALFPCGSERMGRWP